MCIDLLFIAVLLIILMNLQGDNLLINLLLRPYLTPCSYTLNISGNVPIRYGLPLQIWWVETNYVLLLASSQIEKQSQQRHQNNLNGKNLCSKGVWHGGDQTLKSHFSWEVNASTLSLLFFCI
jgi:hypothetical protein